MVCPKCGSPAGPGVARCGACGTALSTQANAVIGVLTPPPEHPANTKAPPDTHVPLPDGITVASPTFDAVTRLTTSGGAGGGAHAPAFVPGRTIANRYHVTRLLGVGGMGAVYQAWDEKLGVAVALKVILGGGPGSTPGANETLERRFKRELLLARQVTHKNVVRIHDLGEIDGTLYITMPYVQGSNLASILAAEGKLAVPRALTIARQVASGLTAAHDAGVIHRDLKPANIMIATDDERALIMDFGIARSTASSEATGTAAIVGTLEYMAPEQAEGREVDQRCDVYAFGLILYDLLGGPRPAGPSAVADLMARMNKPLPSIRSVNLAVPEPLAQLVDRCLQRDPEQRYQTSVDLVAALDALDDNGLVRPGAAPQRIGRGLLWTMAVVIAALAVGLYFIGRRAGNRAAPPVHEPVSVLIADFDNRVNDPVFDGSLEQALTIGVEGASFITTMPRRDAHRLAAQVAAGKLDEATATLISVREGVKFVVAGSIESDGSGYKIAARIIDPAVGKTIKTTTKRAKSKADVLQAVGTLAADVRSGLGDTTPESARLAAMETFTAASLDAVREYTVAQDLTLNSKYEDSIPHYRKAIEADPNFGRAYSGWATAAFELGRNDEAAELWKKALSLMDRMTDRERYRTLGIYYLAIARNYDQAIENYTKLLERYPADRSSHNNLAIAYFNKLDFPKALEEGSKALAIYKGSFKFRNNYLLYAMYAGDFATAENGARDLIREDAKFSDAYVPLAIALLAKGDRAGARTAFQQMAQLGGDGASRATMGLADIAIYEGRYAEAETIVTRGIAQDQKDKNELGLASKYAALAETELAIGRQAAALDAARKALAVTRNESTAVAAARVFLAAGRAADARALAADLGKELQTQSRAYAKVIEGEIALAENRVNEAVDALRAGSRQLDVWLSHYDLGLAYVRASHSAEALAEFDTAMKRRGEATALFLDDIPTYRYLAALPYWLARAQEGVGMKTAAIDNFKAFLSIRAEDTKDPLALDARKRINP
jgi:tetratricopeptide (TPR) repeat protein